MYANDKRLTSQSQDISQLNETINEDLKQFDFIDARKYAIVKCVEDPVNAYLHETKASKT